MKMNDWTEEIVERCKAQEVDVDNCYIVVQRGNTYFNGEPISGYTESKDGKWLCIPVNDEKLSDICGSYEYMPQCFEIRSKMETYLTDGCWSVLSTVWILEIP